MFVKGSRYFKLPNEVTLDAEGRGIESKSIRLLPEVSGTFLHTLEEGDRLDHLAYKYYNQPRKWWHICDANPEFLSPLALVGTEPVVTSRFPLSFTEDRGQPRWEKLFGQLYRMVGVEEVHVEQEIDGEPVRGTAERYGYAVIVTHNEKNVSAEALANALRTVDLEVRDLEVRQPERIARVGKQIVIPPDIVA